MSESAEFSALSKLSPKLGYGDGPNSYAYVGNDPVNAVDSLGLYCTGSRIPQPCKRLDGSSGGIAGGFSGGSISVSGGGGGYYVRIKGPGKPTQTAPNGDIIVTAGRIYQFWVGNLRDIESLFNSPTRGISNVSSAQPQKALASQPKPNGCGRAGGASIPLFKACDAHDICYASSQINQQTCDKRLLEGMQVECRASFTCNTIAYTFYFIVRNFGDDAFNDARREPDARRFNEYLKSLRGR